MSYQSEAALEQQFIEQLTKQSYTSVSIPDYDALVENFKFLINFSLLTTNYFLRPTAILQLRPLSAGGKM